MGNRFAVVLVAAVIGGGTSACSAQPATAPESSGEVTIGGTTHPAGVISCSQLQWYRTIEIGDQRAGAEAVALINGERAEPMWVKFRDYGGFTGSFWEGGAGSANASIDGGVYTFTGTAYGVNASEPNRPTTTNFKIVADC